MGRKAGPSQLPQNWPPGLPGKATTAAWKFFRPAALTWLGELRLQRPGLGLSSPAQRRGRCQLGGWTRRRRRLRRLRGRRRLRGGGGGAWPMKRRGPGRRAPPPAFKRETARCPALGAPFADRATQCVERVVLSVPLNPRRAQAARAAAAHTATRRERRPRRLAALTGERGSAGVCV